MIKYIGSKRRLVPALGSMLRSSQAKTALDLFTGTTRVAQEFKRLGAFVTTVDTASYAEVFSRCYIETDASSIDTVELARIIDELNSIPGVEGYFTDVFCTKSRYFQPHNGRRVDAIRTRLEEQYRESRLFPLLLTSLIEAADRVDSTTGLQMAYLKDWAPRSYENLALRVPELLPGLGRAIRGDAQQVLGSIDRVDLAYLDPPYNQHRYFTNYHIWETLVRWDRPEHYGIACKRIDSRDDSTKSVFNEKRKMPSALGATIRAVNADVVILSYNDESWVQHEELVKNMSVHGHVETLAFDSKRYVGAQIGIYNPKGEKVGRVSHLRNLEYVVVAGPKSKVDSICAPHRASSLLHSQQSTLF